MTEPVRWYAACPRCTAKWFSDQQVAICPRCGSDALAQSRQRVPWLIDNQSKVTAASETRTAASKYEVQDE